MTCESRDDVTTRPRSAAAAPTPTAPCVPRTIAELPFFAAGRFPKPDLIGQCRGDGVDVHRAAAISLPRVRDISLGLSTLWAWRRGDRVAILAESRPEWLLADLAILAAGAVIAPIYPTLSVEQIAFILRDSGASIAVVSSRAQLDKLLVDCGRVAVGCARSSSSIDAVDRRRTATCACVSLADGGRAWAPAILRAAGAWRASSTTRRRRVRPDDLATIIYTSGTTGRAQGRDAHARQPRREPRRRASTCST